MAGVVAGVVVGVVAVVGVLDEDVVGVLLDELELVDDEVVELGVVVGELLVDELLVCGSARTNVTFLLASFPAAFFTVRVKLCCSFEQLNGSDAFVDDVGTPLPS